MSNDLITTSGSNMSASNEALTSGARTSIESIGAGMNEMFELQMEASALMQEVSMTSNLIQKQHEAQMAPIRNLGK